MPSAQSFGSPVLADATEMRSLSVQTREQIYHAARWEWRDQPHRPRRIGLRESKARDGRERGSARGQMQKMSAEKFHFEPPFTSFDHLVGAGEQHGRNGEAERPRGR